MISVQIGEFKTKMSFYLQLLQKGVNIGLLYGRGKKPVAKITPWFNEKSERKLGVLSKYGTVKLKSFKITDEELLSP